MTNIKRATVSSGEGEAPLREIFETWNQGITVRRGDQWLFVNQAFADMCGYGSPAEVLSLGSTLATLPEHERERIKRYQGARDSGEDMPTCYELQAVRKDGSEWWAENRVQEIVWEGEPAYLTAVTDITARKEAPVQEFPIPGTGSGRRDPPCPDQRNAELLGGRRVSRLSGHGKRYHRVRRSRRTSPLRARTARHRDRRTLGIVRFIRRRGSAGHQ